MSNTKSDISNRESYDTYLRLSNERILDKEPISPKDYFAIIDLFFKFLIDLVFEGAHIVLPFGIGQILITGWKTKPRFDKDGKITGLSPDWVKTMELWKKDPEAKTSKKVLYHFNEHTAGIRYKITWVKKDVKFENHNLYALVFSRTNKRAIHAKIIGGKEYFVTN